MTSQQRTGPSTPTQLTPEHKEVRRREVKISFSNPPVGNDLPPKLSAPVGHRGILAEVRAPYPLQPPRAHVPNPRTERDLVKPPEANQGSCSLSPAPSKPIPIAQERGTMTRGYLGGRPQPITELAWISSLDIKPNRGGSSGRNSGQESGHASRINSRSRAPSLADRSVSLAMSTHHGNGDGKGSQEDEHRDSNLGPSLHDE